MECADVLCTNELPSQRIAAAALGLRLWRAPDDLQIRNRFFRPTPARPRALQISVE